MSNTEYRTSNFEVFLISVVLFTSAFEIRSSLFDIHENIGKCFSETGSDLLPFKGFS